MRTFFLPTDNRMGKSGKQKVVGITCIFLVFLILIPAQKAVAAENLLIREVKCALSFTPELYGGVRDRIVRSIENAGEEIFLNKPVSAFNQRRAELVNRMKELFNRVLVGFEVTSLRLDIAERVTIHVMIQAKKPQVNQVMVDIQVVGMEKPGLLLTQNKNYLRQQLSSFFIGLPVESLEWSIGIVEPILKFTAQQTFPGFAITAEFITGPTITISLILEPNTTVLEDIRLNITTATMPQTVVNLLKPKIQEALSIYKGLPIIFLQANEGYIFRNVEREIDRSSLLSPLRIHSEMEWRLRNKAEVEVNVDSESFQWHVSSNFAVDGRKDADLRLKAGWLLHRQWSLASELKMKRGLDTGFLAGVNYKIWRQSDLSWMFDPRNKWQEMTLAYQLDRRTRLGLKWEMSPGDVISFIQIKFNPHWSMEVSAYPDKSFTIDMAFNL